MAGVESAELSASGGPDLVDVGDLSGTELKRVEADLGLADGARDQVFAAGSSAPDSIAVAASGETALVTKLAAEVRVENARPSDDRLTVQAGDGGDLLDARGAAGALVGITLEGGAGGDVIFGGDAAEVIRGGPDNDTVLGNRGDDAIDLGDGEDSLTWRPGDGGDTADGGPGIDRLTANGTDGDDVIDVGAAGSRMTLTRNGAERLSLDTLETIRQTTLAGTDTVSVRDLTGIAATSLGLDLAAGDQKSDVVTVDGSAGPDSVRVTSSGTSHDVSGLAAGVLVERAEPGDRLALDGRAGDDVIDATAMAKDKLQPFLDGGAGKDIIGGSPGQDVIAGGFGDDVSFMGGGVDTFNWRPGDGSDIVEGQAGTDFLRMDGSGADERFEVSPAGGRTIVTRDVSKVSMDLGGVDRLDINAAGGADAMRVDDLSVTETEEVAFELAPFRGTTATDLARDSLLVNGTNGNDAIDVTAGGHQVRVAGLAATTVVNRSDPTLDTLHVDTRQGIDLVSVKPAVRALLGFSSS